MRQESSFWSLTVVARVDVGATGAGQWTRTDLKELFSDAWSLPIAAFTEFRYAFRTSRLVPLPPPLGMQHSFAILEVPGSGGRAGCEICVERFDNRFELMLGSRTVIRALAPSHRATGEPRGRDAGQPLEAASRTVLGAAAGLPEVRVSDFYAWITGPLASAWQPYDLQRMQCQHFAWDLGCFLRCEENEIKVHALHGRPPSAGRLE